MTIDEPIIDFRILKSLQLSAGVGFAAALDSADVMGAMSRLRGRIDARYTITAGSLVFLLSMWFLSRLSLESETQEMFWLLIMRVLGLGLIFVPLTNASRADLPPRDLAQGAGMFNLMRPLGGSMGIAVMATLRGRWTSAQRSILTEHVGATDRANLERLNFYARGAGAHGTPYFQAKAQATAILARQIGRPRLGAWLLPDIPAERDTARLRAPFAPDLAHGSRPRVGRRDALAARPPLNLGAPATATIAKIPVLPFCALSARLSTGPPRISDDVAPVPRRCTHPDARVHPERVAA
ncbi:MAG: hypothetical protein ABI910_02035 [Gemmatimonadota bacterium]